MPSPAGSLAAPAEVPGDPAGGRRPRRTPVPPTVGRVLGAVVAGLLWLASFEPLHWWWTAPIGVAFFVAAVRGTRLRTAAALGAVAGLVFFVPLLSWVRAIGVDGWLALAGTQVAATAVLGVALALVGRLRWWPLAVPAAWIAWDAARMRWPFGGFTWGRLAYGQDAGPAAVYASWGGATAVTVAVVLLGATAGWFALACARGRQRQMVLGGTGMVAIVTLPFAVGAAGTSAIDGRPATATVAVVQGNVPGVGMGAFDRAFTVLRNHAEATHALADDVAAGRQPQPDFVVWPENAADVSPYEHPEARRLVDEAAAAVGVPVLIGAVLDEDGHRYNAGLVWEADAGETDRYVKRHLVPFGERVPLRPVLARLISRFDRVPVDFTGGPDDAGAVEVGGTRVADVICFEVGYDALVTSGVADGGRLVVVQSNNATYGDVQSTQQLSMARLRAVEHGRTVVVATTNGVSALVTPDGKLLQQSQMRTAVTYVEDVPLRDTLTPGSRYGGWVEALLVVAGLLAVGAATRSQIVARRSR